MIEKNVSQIRKERFEFKLTINDNIICQRYFKINNFNENSLNSIELKETLDLCVNLIDNDLKSKSRVYMWYTAPYIFSNSDEMHEWFSNPLNAKEVISGKTILLRNSDVEFWWDGNELIETKDKSNDGEFFSLDEENLTIFKFEFLDDGKPVYTKIWDGRYYPKFVRNGVDLSNKKGKPESDEVSSLLSHMINDKGDLVPLIIKEICDTCTVSSKKWYTTSDTYLTKKVIIDNDGTLINSHANDGPVKVYDYSIENMWNKYVNKMAKLYKKKTDEYFKTL